MVDEDPKCDVCGEVLRKDEKGYSPAICWMNAEEELGRRQVKREYGRYVEGFAVRGRTGLQVISHGWVEFDGTPEEVTPHAHIEAPDRYFPGLRLTMAEKEAYRDLTVPLCRDALALEGHVRYDAAIAAAYAQAKQAAVAYCTEHNTEEGESTGA